MSNSTVKDLLEEMSLEGENLTEEEASTLSTIFTQDERHILEILYKSDDALTAADVHNRFKTKMFKAVSPYSPEPDDTWGKRVPGQLSMDSFKEEVTVQIPGEYTEEEWLGKFKDPDLSMWSDLPMANVLHHLGCEVPIHRTIKNHLDTLADQNAVIRRDQKATQSKSVYALHPKMRLLENKFSIISTEN